MTDIYDITRKTYNSNSDIFIEKWKDTNEIDNGKIETFIALIPRGARILDIGAGFGKDVHYLVNKGFDCIGIDFSDEFITRSKELYTNVNIQKMNFLDIDFEDNSFDALWSRGALFHISKADFEKVIKKLSGILKSGGIFYLQLIEGSNDGIMNGVGDVKAEAYYAYYTNDEIKTIMTKYGFEYIKDYPVNGWLNHYYRLSK